MFRYVRCKTLARAVLTLTAVAFAATASAQAQAQSGNQTYRDAHRLGGPTTRFYYPPLTNAASLKRYANNKRVVTDIGIMLKQAGIPDDVAAKVVPTLQNPTEIVKAATCADATPADGTIVDCTFPVGGTMEWMATRPRVKGKRSAQILRNLRWAGKKPFDAFLFRVTSEDKIYIFAIPKPCGNLSLVRVEDVKYPDIDVTVDRVCTPPLGGTLSATVRVPGGDTSKLDRVRVSINGQQAGELTGPSWSMTSNQPGTYTFEATSKNGRPYPSLRTKSVTVDPCPPKPEPRVVQPTCNLTVAPPTAAKGGYQLNISGTATPPGSRLEVTVTGPTGTQVGQPVALENGAATVTVPSRPAGTYQLKGTVTAAPGAPAQEDVRYEGTGTCQASVDITVPPSTVHFFIDGAFGKERRERPVSELDSSLVPPGVVLPAGASFGQCSPEAGVKFGVGKRFANDWEVAGDVGVGLMFVDTDKKVRKNPLFIDVEANKYLANGMFLGTGISFWDLTRSETFTPAWLVHFGVPLNGRDAHVPVYFLGEGRLFFDNIDSASSNYQFWGGVRVQFPTNK